MLLPSASVLTMLVIMKPLYECMHIHSACNSNSVTVLTETNIEPGAVQGIQEQSVSYTKDSYTLLATVIVLIQYPRFVQHYVVPHLEKVLGYNISK